MWADEQVVLAPTESEGFTYRGGNGTGIEHASRILILESEALTRAATLSAKIAVIPVDSFHPEIRSIRMCTPGGGNYTLNKGHPDGICGSTAPPPLVWVHGLLIPALSLHSHCTWD